MKIFDKLIGARGASCVDENFARRPCPVGMSLHCSKNYKNNALIFLKKFFKRLKLPFIQ